MEKEGSNVMISSGMHQFQHGQIQSIERMTEIPFAHVLLRNKAGDLSARGDGAYVPLKYCHEITKEEAEACKAARKEMMKRQRARSKEVEKEIAARVLEINSQEQS